MDFGFSEEQEAVRDLATQILETQLPHERLRALETSGEYFARDAWAELAKANLLGIALPESAGGSGLGFVELCLLLRTGRTHLSAHPVGADAGQRGGDCRVRYARPPNVAKRCGQRRSRAHLRVGRGRC